MLCSYGLVTASTNVGQAISVFFLALWFFMGLYFVIEMGKGD
jgi:hypothetical protein